MTIASIIFQRRRELALCTASILLHLMALSWVAQQLGPAGRALRPGEPAAIVAVLHAAPPQPRPVAAATPSARPARKRRPAPPTPVAEAAPPANDAPAMEQGGAAQAVAVVQSDQPAAAQATQVAATPVEPAPAEPVLAEPVPAPPEPAPAVQPRQYRVNMPPSAEIRLDVVRSDADGKLWHGEAVMGWKLDGDSYSMKVEAGIRVLVVRVNLVLLASEGKIGKAGFAPVTMTEKRRGRSPTATYFSERDGRITFSASQAAFAMLPGTQDKATLPLQLAAIARGDASQLQGDIDIMVGEDKDASVFHFVVLGQEELATNLGRLQAWRLSRPPRAGAYGSRLDIWLAPKHGWYPVQIRNTEANGAVTTQTVSKILLTDSGT